MKFGCCLNLVATRPDGIGDEWLEDLRDVGFDYAELPLAEVTALDRDRFAALTDRVAAAGVPCEACNNFFPATLRLTGPHADLSAAAGFAQTALERARALGAQRVVFGSGPAKRVPEGFPPEEAYGQVADLLRAVGPVAGELGITIAIEPLRRAECNLINTFAEGVRLARDVDDPAVAVLADFYHFSEEGDSARELGEYGADRLCHVHFSNPVGRVYPVREDEADYRPFVAALEKAGYDERVSCEARAPHGFRRDAVTALAFFRRVFPGREG